MPTEMDFHGREIPTVGRIVRYVPVDGVQEGFEANPAIVTAVQEQDRTKVMLDIFWRPDQPSDPSPEGHWINYSVNQAPVTWHWPPREES